MDVKTISLVLQIALGIVMLGLGLHLCVDDFKRILQYPKAVIIGLGMQCLVLPFAAFAIAVAFQFRPELAVGLMLLAASPGGITANLYSHLFRGDVALNITLTAINSLICLVTLPLIVGLSVKFFMSNERQIPLPVEKIIGVFIIVILPVVMGMLVRKFRPVLASKFDKPVRLLSLLVLALAIIVSILSKLDDVLENMRAVGLAVLLFNITSLAGGFFILRLFGIGKRQAIAAGMEIGIHNGTLAIAIATTAFGDLLFAMPAAIYSILMFFTAAAFGYLINLKGEEAVQ